MSWYFFGGFSAYAMVPSARVVNHSGCAVAHGWSGAACRAKSSATSRPVPLGLGDEDVEVLDRAEVGVDRVVPAVLAADRPGGADVVRRRGQRVVGALAVDLADRVDRRQVDHVEAHGGDGRQPLGGGPQGAADDLAGLLVDVGALGAREELVPAREQRALAVDEERERPLGAEQVAQRVLGEHLRQGVGLGCGEACPDGPVGVLDGLDGVLDDRLLPAVEVTLLGHPLEQQHALGEHQLDVDAGADLDAGVVQPGADDVAPRLDLEGPRALGVGGDGRGQPEQLVGYVVHPHRWASYAVRGR